MAATLINIGAVNIGTADVVAYTVPANKTAMLLGCSVTNIYGAIVPLDVLVRKGAIDVRLAKERRVANGKSEEMVAGKVVLAAGDALVLRGYAEASFDALISLAEGV